MNPLDLLRDRRGRLLEIPILIAFVCLSLAIGVGQRSWWKGPVYAALGFVAVFGALIALAAVTEKLDSVPAVRRFLDSWFVGFLGAMAAYAVGFIGGGALWGFVAMFAAPRLSGTPEGQLLAMRAIAAAGALLGVFVVFRARRQPARF